MPEHEGKEGRKESGSEEKEEGRRIGNKSVRRRREESRMREGTERGEGRVKNERQGEERRKRGTGKDE